MNNYTISSFINYVVDKYKQSKLEYSKNELSILRNDIKIIISNFLEVNITYLYINFDQPLSNDIVEGINVRINRYFNGEPISYIIGYKYFWNQKLFVTKNNLIPRADTEIIIEAIINDVLDKYSNLNILDLGTGTGAIALALASELPNSCVIAVDISDKALDVAKKNTKENLIYNVELIQSNWYENIYNKKFDIIVSNPPYISYSDKNIMQEVKQNEPHIALFSDNDGLADIRTIISQSHIYLNKNARIYIEHGFNQTNDVTNIFKVNQFFRIKTIKDLNKKDRCTYATFDKIF